MKTSKLYFVLLTLALSIPLYASESVPNRLLVQVDEILGKKLANQCSSELLNINQNYDLKSLFHIPTDPEKRQVWYETGMNCWYVLNWDTPLTNPKKILQMNKDVLFVIEDILISTALLPDEYENFDLWALEKMNCENAWDIYHGADDVLVAIIDTGIEPTHEDLEEKIWINPGEDINHNGQWDDEDNNGVDDDQNGYVDDLLGYDFVSITAAQITQLGIDPVEGQDYGPQDNEVFPDYVGHGTYCAGIAGAATNNGTGVASVSWGTRLMPVKVAFPVYMNGQPNGIMTMSDFAQGIQYAVDNNADIISMSLASSQELPAVLTAVNYAYAFGIISVAGAGNAGQVNDWYPAAYDNVISVAATDRFDRKAYFSCYGSTIDLCAPGVDIISSTPGYGFMPQMYTGENGTSASTPLVSGAIALLKSSEPDLSHIEIRERLLSSCINIDTLNSMYEGQLGAGRLDVNLLLGGTSRIEEDWEIHPVDFDLSTPYPNPFNATTRFTISLAGSQYVSIKVVDVCGREVTKIAEGLFPGGSHDLVFNAEGISNGTYFIKSKFSGGEMVSRVTLVK